MPLHVSLPALISAAALASATGALAQTVDHSGHAGHPAPAPSPAVPAPPAALADPDDHSGHDHGGDTTKAAPAENYPPLMDPKFVEQGPPMPSPLGAYAMNRDASGTSWQPDASPPMGGHVMAGDWMVMRHAMLDLVHSSQGGPRGDDQTFVAGMAMISGSRDLGPGKLNLRAMLSPDPLMGKRGYPLLLAAGETADGATHLVDRQHPHDLFMELSASYSLPLGEGQSAFLYAGLPGEPAFGPPAFMHRTAAMPSPEAPISHHWLDSTHITFGVVTAGYVRGDWKVEASAFRGREPDETRYDIESPKLDSAAVRLSWNPTRNWSLQTSWATLESPEQLDPATDEERLSASALYARPLSNGGLFAATAAWGTKDPSDDERRDAALLEASYTNGGPWTVFARAEWVEQNELDPSHTTYDVSKLSVGAIYDISVNDHVSVGIGGLVSAYDIPAGLTASYDSPTSGMAFLRVRLH